MACCISTIAIKILKLRNKGAIGGRGLNIATQERKICDVEIEIVTFVKNGSMKLTVPPDRQK